MVTEAFFHGWVWLPTTLGIVLCEGKGYGSFCWKMTQIESQQFFEFFVTKPFL